MTSLEVSDAALKLNGDDVKFATAKDAIVFVHGEVKEVRSELAKVLKLVVSVLILTVLFNIDKAELIFKMVGPVLASVGIR